MAETEKRRPHPAQVETAGNAITDSDPTAPEPLTPERALVAELLMASQDAQDTALRLVQPEDLGDPVLTHLWETAARMHQAGEPVALLTLIAEVERAEGMRPWTVHLSADLFGWQAEISPGMAGVLLPHEVRHVLERSARRRGPDVFGDLAVLFQTAPISVLKPAMAERFRMLADLLDRAEAVGSI